MDASVEEEGEKRLAGWLLQLRRDSREPAKALSEE